MPNRYGLGKGGYHLSSVDIAKVKVTSDIIVKVSFKAKGVPPAKKHRLDFSCSEGGTLTAELDGTEIVSGTEVKEGAAVKFTAKPADYHVIKNWKLNDSLINGAQLTYNLTITSAHNLHVDFKLIKIFCAIQAGAKSLIWHNGKNNDLPPVKDGWSVAVSSICSDGNDIYAAGAESEYGISKPLAWKNNTVIWHAPNTMTGTIEDINVNNGFIYMAGSYDDGNSSGAAVNKVNIKTLTNELIFLSKDTAADWYEVCSMYVDGSTIYAAGTKKKSQPIFWKAVGNSAPEIKELETENKKGEAYTIFVSGNDIYIGGKSGGKPVIWKNGKKEELPCTDTGEIRSITVSDGVIYAVGKSGGKAALWQNGKKQELSSNESAAVSISVKEGTVYISGKEGISSSASAVYWQNGTKYELGTGTAVDILIKN